MHKIVNPQQTRRFDSFSNVLTEKTRQRLLAGWHGVFRHVILELMPVEQISQHFAPVMGRPSKELYSMAGLLLIALINTVIAAWYYLRVIAAAYFADRPLVASLSCPIPLAIGLALAAGCTILLGCAPSLLLDLISK